MREASQKQLPKSDPHSKPLAPNQVSAKTESAIRRGGNRDNHPQGRNG
ncbi:uncharacterized protein METZ01_LOCUS471534, partial [marine metagenome]